MGIKTFIFKYSPVTKYVIEKHNNNYYKKGRPRMFITEIFQWKNIHIKIIQKHTSIHVCTHRLKIILFSHPRNCKIFFIFILELHIWKSERHPWISYFYNPIVRI